MGASLWRDKYIHQPFVPPRAVSRSEKIGKKNLKLRLNQFGGLGLANDVPADVWFRIFLYVNYEDLGNCLKTCKMFNEVIEDDFFWLEYAKTNGQKKDLPPLEWRQAVVNGKLVAPDPDVDVATLRFDLKKMLVSNGGFGRHEVHPMDELSSVDQLRCEFDCEFVIGSDGFESPPEGVSEERADIDRCWTTSYLYSCRTICIDLLEWGVQDWVMDLVRPAIRVSEWVAPRQDSACEYNLIAQLTPERESSEEPNLLVPERYSRCKYALRSWEQFSGAPWEKVEVEISEYPVGMRYLLISSGGKDNQFWSGYYGPKMAKLELEVVLPNAVRLHSRDSMRDPIPLLGDFYGPRQVYAIRYPFFANNYIYIEAFVDRLRHGETLSSDDDDEE